jgi:hypothetical protein
MKEATPTKLSGQKLFIGMMDINPPKNFAKKNAKRV